jgi:hypothetical protein
LGNERLMALLMLLVAVLLPLHGATAHSAARCRTGQLSIRTGHSFAGLGTAGAVISFTNRSHRPCRLTGWPHVVGVTASGSRVALWPVAAAGTIGLTVRVTGTPVIALAPGQHADAVFSGADGPAAGTACRPRLRWLRVAAPSGGRAVRISAWIGWLARDMPTCGPIRLSPLLPARDLYHG